MGKAKSLDGWLTAREAAVSRQAHRNAIYQAVEDGRITPQWKRVGNRAVMVFSPEDVAKIKGEL